MHRHVNYRLYPEDAYLPTSENATVFKRGTRRGGSRRSKGALRSSIVRIERAMGLAPERIASVTPFEEPCPTIPLKRILLEDPASEGHTMRAVDILTPIGFGQRGLIVAPPRTGKTILLPEYREPITANSPDEAHPPAHRRAA